MVRNTSFLGLIVVTHHHVLPKKTVGVISGLQVLRG